MHTLDTSWACLQLPTAVSEYKIDQGPAFADPTDQHVSAKGHRSIWRMI